MSKISFGAWLKGKRKSFPLTQEELGERIGYSGRTIEKIEAGSRRPSRAIAQALAAAFRVPGEEQEAFVEFARAGQDDAQGAAWPISALRFEESAPWRRERPVPNNLPTPLTGFIGREQHMASALPMLARPDIRLMTLQGPAGVGKTRLALQLGARMLAHFSDGVFFVPLAGAREASVVVPLMARALGLREAAGATMLSLVESYLRGKSVLLVLDNFEQVSEAGADVASLLEAAPGLKALVTSRAKLHVYGEYVFPVPPLDVPDSNGPLTPEQAAGYDSVRLFCERAAAADPVFAMCERNVNQVARICAGLDGLPLAIELAAALTGTWSLEEIAAKLDSRLSMLAGGPVNLPPRQRTLRAAIEWGYNLLSDAEQALFREMAVFVGGAEAEAVSSVASNFSADTLASLAGKSMLVQQHNEGAVRTGMLETIREYAAEKLAEHRTLEPARTRHAEYYARLAEATAHKISGPEQAACLALLEQEQGNLGAALAGMIEWGRAADALKLASSLWTFWHLRGYPSEGLGWLKQALSMRSVAEAPAEVLGNAYNAAGNLAWTGGDYAAAREMHERALSVRQGVGDRLKIGDSLNNLGIIAQMERDYKHARLLFEQCQVIYREVGDKGGEASALNNLGQIYLAEQDYERALSAQREAREIWRELGSDFGIGVSLNIMGEAERFQGNYREAHRLYKSALQTYRKLSYKRGVAYTLHNMGHAALGMGNADEAVSRLRESLALCRELDHTEGIILCLAGLGKVLLIRDRPQDAARILGAVGSALEANRVHLHPLELRNFHRSVNEVKRVLAGHSIENRGEQEAAQEEAYQGEHDGERTRENQVENRRAEGGAYERESGGEYAPSAGREGHAWSLDDAIAHAERLCS